LNTRVEVTVRVVPEDTSIPITKGYAEYTSKDEYVTHYTVDVKGCAQKALLQALTARATMVETEAQEN
jgi:hypothetical protein